MNPFYELGTLCTGPVCEHCHKDCGGTCGGCNKCDKKPDCACPEPFLDIDKVPNKEATYLVNDNGKTAKWDIAPAIKAAQTDTTLVVDIVKRLLQYSAERHTDSISAKDLGAILHLTDLGDVTSKGAQNGASLVYKKSDNCPAGCVGTSNNWEPWNALEEQATSVAYGYGFDANGVPATIQQPSNPNQYYNLGWNGNRQLSYAQPVESAPRLDAQGYAYQLFVDPSTLQPYYVKVKQS